MQKSPGLAINKELAVGAEVENGSRSVAKTVRSAVLARHRSACLCKHIPLLREMRSGATLARRDRRASAVVF